MFRRFSITYMYGYITALSPGVGMAAWNTPSTAPLHLMSGWTSAGHILHVNMCYTAQHQKYLRSEGKIRFEKKAKPEASLWKISNPPLCQIVNGDSVVINARSKLKFSLVRKRTSNAAYIIINILYTYQRNSCFQRNHTCWQFCLSNSHIFFCIPLIEYFKHMCLLEFFCV